MRLRDVGLWLQATGHLQRRIAHQVAVPPLGAADQAPGRFFRTHRSAGGVDCCAFLAISCSAA